MSSLKVLAVAGAVVVAAAAHAQAGDLSAPPPPHAYDAPLRGTVSAGGLYLRGDIGVGITKIKKFDSVGYANSSIGGLVFSQQQYPTPTIIGLGVGYKFNNWFRADLTGEYRAASAFGYTDRFNRLVPLAGSQTNTFRGNMASSVFMANGYVDLGTFCALGCLTPFLGAGIGVAAHSVSALTDQGIVFDGVGISPTLGLFGGKTTTSLAWALHAGLGYQVNQNLTLEASYRYLNMGHAQSGRGSNPFVPMDNYAPIKLRDIDSHDFRLGMRWALNGNCCGSPPPEPVFAPAPMVRKF
jgi:opacity protein-like surface antigen